MSDFNPYAPPRAASDLEAASFGLTSDEDERIRTEHLNHEWSVRALGTLYLLAAACMPVSVLAMLFVMPQALSGVGSWSPLYLAVAVAWGALYGAIGWGLRRLATPARIGATVFAVVGVLGFPIGTVISIYLLHLLLSAKGSMVFSAEYAGVVARTPHLEYRLSPLAKGLLFVLLLLFLAMLAQAISSVF